MTRREMVAAVVAVLSGLAIAAVDSSPRFDDTAVTAVALVLAAALATAVAGRRPFVWALLVGLPTPFIEIARGGGTGSLLALAFAGVGAVLGRLLSPRRLDPSSR